MDSRLIKELHLRLNPGVVGGSVALAFGLLMVGGEGVQAPAQQAESRVGAVPLWAYPVEPGAAVAPNRAAAGGSARPVAPGGGVARESPIQHVPGSGASYTKAQIGSLFVTPDWFPDGHPAMPTVVAEGRKPDLNACGHCHLPNGLGRPENESLAGLPAAYIEEQVSDFKEGLRSGSDPGMPVWRMVGVAKAATPEEVKVAAEYFSSLKLQKWIRVVETDVVPTTRPAGGMLVVRSPAATEPIGERVIEVPEDLEQTELRNPTSGFVAYVPKGSLAAGELLVRTGGDGRFLACTVCHGSNLKGQYLKGMGNVPPIAGRSPSQIARQLFDFRGGVRHGVNSGLMRMEAGKLSDGDVVAISGYLASLNP